MRPGPNNLNNRYDRFRNMLVRAFVLLCWSAAIVASDQQGNVPKNPNKFTSDKKHIGNEVIESKVRHRDCHAWRLVGAKKSGVHIIYPNGTYPIKVYCEHGVNQSFTVIQRRNDGAINFYTTWPYYKAGFGSAQGDYWAGLDSIHQLTINGNNKLQINMQDWAGISRYAQYSKFLVMDESNQYRMFVSGKTGTLPGDDMAYHNGMNFATPDRPDPQKCAVNQRAGWWYNYCAYTLPNGIYYYGGHYNPNPSGFYDGIYWKDWGGFAYSMKFVSLSLYK